MPNTPYGPNNPHPLSQLKTELVWEGKYDEYGNRREVNEMRAENEQLKAVVAELTLDNRRLTPAPAGGAGEKSLLGKGVRWDE